MATISFIVPDEMDEYISNCIKKLFDGKHGAKKRALMAAVKIFADRTTGMNIEEQYQKALIEINEQLKDENEKKCSIDNCPDTPTHLTYGKPVCDKHFEDKRKKALQETIPNPQSGTPEQTFHADQIKIEEKLPEIGRVIDNKVDEVSFASMEQEPKIVEQTKPQPVQVSGNGFAEYDAMSYEELIEAKAKVSDFKTDEDTDRYNYIIQRMVNIKRSN